MTDSWDADLAGDGYLFWRLRRMSAPEVTQPLVTLAGDPYNMRDCEVTLTDAGHEVLVGRANAIDLNGIDDWLLGVHLVAIRRTPASPFGVHLVAIRRTPASP